MKTEEGNGNPRVALPSVVLGFRAGGGTSLSVTAGGEVLELGPSLLEREKEMGWKRKGKREDGDGVGGGGAWEELWFSAQTESPAPWSSHPAQEAQGPVLEYERERDPGQPAFFSPERMTNGPVLDLCPAEGLVATLTSSSSSSPETPNPNQAQAHGK